MPRKTKAQKLMSDKKKLEYTSSSPSYSVSNIKVENYKKEVVETIKIPQNLYLASDLKKTLILTLVAIVFELVLYWLWR